MAQRTATDAELRERGGRSERFWHQIKADGDADKTDKERGRAFILDSLAPIKRARARTQSNTRSPQEGGVCVCASAHADYDLTSGEVASLSGP